MNPLLLTAALAVGQLLPNSPANQSATHNAQGGAHSANAAATASLDGNWTVVSFEKNGQAVSGAQHMQVSIKNGTVTFTGKGSSEPAMRLELGHHGTIRVVPENEGQHGQNQGQQNHNKNQAQPAQNQGQQNQNRNQQGQNEGKQGQNQNQGQSQNQGQNQNQQTESANQAAIRAARGQELPTATNPRPTSTANNQNANNQNANNQNANNQNANNQNAQTGAAAHQGAVSQAQQHAHHPHHGVYVLSHDYFAVSLFDDASGAHGAAHTGGQSGSPKVVVILRRAGGSEGSNGGSNNSRGE